MSDTPPTLPTTPARSPRPRRRRYVVAPVLAGALVAGAVVVPQVASAQSAPDLPPLTPQGLVAKALSSHVTSFSGQVRLTANLGLPDLSGLTGGQAAPAGPAGSLLSYLSGTHTAQV
ncbi:MAG: hypothetical protein ACRD0J_14600, partial [Acidimicrobiales bacterium]